MLVYSLIARPADSRTLSLEAVTVTPTSFQAVAGASGTFTWWLPSGADSFELPIAAGIHANANDRAMMNRLEIGSPWNLKDLPALGARYGDRTLVAITPWPHYADLVIGKRIGIQFAFPKERNNATPCEIVVRWADPNPLEAARVFREWRKNAPNIGGLNRPRTLSQKVNGLPKVERLFGAAHFYLWGPTMFSRHDVPRNKWLALAKAIQDAPPGSVVARLKQTFSVEQRDALTELAKSDWPMKYLTIAVANGIESTMTNRTLLELPADAKDREVVNRNRQAIAEELGEFTRSQRTWGDGLSITLLNQLHEAGIDRAVLCLSDLHKNTVQPEVAAYADRLGYLIGPYDSYHSVHSPNAHPDQTWETAQFDRDAYEHGRVIKEQGRRQGGFKGRGYHFSPAAAWPYVQRRVGSILENNPYTTWFIDCDATAECFDDFNPRHPSNRVDDMNQRRHRLRWLESDQRLVLGSEGGSVLFADVIHFGHGVHTPYIGHLHPGFREKQSRHYLGRHWPPDTPEQSFKPVPVPPSLITPYFDPKVRIPLYQAALGDELIATHHWSFDSLKLEDIESTRSLLEILYLVPPMYHINRESWPQRCDKIRYHVNFWSPLHRRLAQAPLVGFKILTPDRLVQQTTFRGKSGDVTITVNFGAKQKLKFPANSATVEGNFDIKEKVYRTR